MFPTLFAVLAQKAFQKARDIVRDQTPETEPGSSTSEEPSSNPEGSSLLERGHTSSTTPVVTTRGNRRSFWKFWRWWRRTKPAPPSFKVPFHVVSVLRTPLIQQVGLTAPPVFIQTPTDANAKAATALPLVELMQMSDVGSRIVTALAPGIQDLISLALASRSLWESVAELDPLWRDVYLDNEPLSTPEFRRLLTSPKVLATHAPAVLRLPVSGILQSVWMRTCCLLYSKPKVVVVLAGKDPILVRRLGQPEAGAEAISLGINYHLDDFLDDEDERRFAVEFPQLFQELNVGDLVITQDYKGAGCWTAVADPAVPPGPANFLVLKKNSHDTAGYGILTAEVAPPSFPLFYYSDVEFTDEEEIDLRSLKGHEVYWYAYTQLKCGSLYSWAEQEFFQDLAF